MNTNVKNFEFKVINFNRRNPEKHPEYVKTSALGNLYYKIRIRELGMNHDDWKMPFYVFDHKTYRVFGEIKENISNGRYLKKNNGDLILDQVYPGVWHVIKYYDDHPEPSKVFFYANTFGYERKIKSNCHVGFYLPDDFHNTQVEIDTVIWRIKERRNRSFKNK